MLKYGITKTGAANLMAMLAADAKDVVITAADVAATGIVADSTVAGANTAVTLNVVEGSTVVNAESPALKRHYTRLDLTETLTALAVDTAIDEEIGTADEAALIAKFVDLTGIKFEDGDLTVIAIENVATFTVAADHAGFIGEAELTFKVPVPILPKLDEIFTEESLNGFDAPAVSG